MLNIYMYKWYIIWFLSLNSLIYSILFITAYAFQSTIYITSQTIQTQGICTYSSNKHNVLHNNIQHTQIHNAHNTHYLRPSGGKLRSNEVLRWVDCKRSVWPDCNIGPLSGVIVTSGNMAPIIRKKRVESVALSIFTYLVFILLHP